MALISERPIGLYDYGSEGMSGQRSSFSQNSFVTSPRALRHHTSMALPLPSGHFSHYMADHDNRI